MIETQIIQLSPLCLSSDIDLARSLSGLFFGQVLGKVDCFTLADQLRQSAGKGSVGKFEFTAKRDAAARRGGKLDRGFQRQ